MKNLQELITKQEFKEMFDEYLDESYGSFEMAGHHFWASKIMKETDPIMYREAELSYADMLIREGREIEEY